MLYRDIARILGIFFLGFSLTFLVPLILAAYYEFVGDPGMHPQPHSTMAFIGSILITVAVATIFLIASRNHTGQLYRREGLTIVVFLWILTPVFAALPFVLSETLKNPIQAYFESVSGLTTTGSTVMQAKKFDPKTGVEIPIETPSPYAHQPPYSFYGTINPVRHPQTNEITHEGLEAVSKAILFWRSFTNWIGGGGIVVLFIAVLPALGAGGKILFQAEVPGPNKDTLTPRLKETALHLWKIYIGLSIIQVAILMVTNPKMEWFDAITITFATISTGGFSIRNESIGYYQNSATEWVVILFMILGSINFSLFYYAIKGKFYRFNDSELRLHLCLLFAASAIVTWKIWGSTEEFLTTSTATSAYSFSDAIRESTFQVVSAQTTTGFASINYDIWPSLALVIMLIVMYFGGMAGSTSGGIKTVRLAMLYRILQNKVESLFRPESVRQIIVNNKVVDTQAGSMVLCFFLLIVTISVLGTTIYVADNIDMETSIGLTACMINGTGLSFRMAGPLNSCALLPDISLINSSMLMIMGRLEFFAVLALLVPSFWKQTS